jgi:hypothetical protein
MRFSAIRLFRGNPYPIFRVPKFWVPLISGILRITVLKTRILENSNYSTRIYRVTRMPRPN